MQEVEAKFYVMDLARIESYLKAMRAELVQQRVLERNIRFDLPDARLRSDGRVLRLRQDTAARLTYKGASNNEQGVLSRTEIEFTVEDFEKTRQFLEALGYRQLVYYEKYRTTYEFGRCHIMLDELPFGNFVEIEGETVESIHQAASQLRLNQETAIATSYSALFDRAKRILNLSFQDISFEKFADLKITSDHLEVKAADIVI